jgi:Protein of unknown function (DUF3710)
VFRRKGKSDQGDEALDPESDDVDAPPASEAAEAAPATSDLTSAVIDLSAGPYDVGDAPSDEIPRIDLGSLKVPMVDGVEVRLDMDEATGEPTQLVLADGDSMMQLGVFAAPRSSGIWAEIRGEIAESLQGTGGSAEEVDGPFGTELVASVPTGDPSVPFAPARFVGVDRPRWFLRGLLSGPAAVDGGAAERLVFALRGTVVVRGTEAMPIRDPLPLRLPPEALQMAQEQIAAQMAEAEGSTSAPTLEQLDPGPTITETR